MMQATVNNMTNYIKHIPVLLEESVDLLVTDPDGIYVDATLGGGGHTSAILEQLSEDAILFGIDQDQEALDEATSRIGRDDRFHPVIGNFGYLSTLLPLDVHGSVSGILFDLGVSTHQIKEPDRGFSFQMDGPLDMRMGAMSGVSAYQVVNEYPYEKLRDIIYHYGEERLSRQIARAILDRRPVETTGELYKIISDVVYSKEIKSAARVFQAIRIEVNRELDMLKTALEAALQLLKPEGRMVAISYHSLEDRIVKTFFKSGNHEGRIEKDFYGHELTPVEPIGKLKTPGKEEVRTNPASRSAKLRAARKLDREEE